VETALAVLAALALLVAPAGATKRHKHKPSGVEGVVLNSTCYGPCVDPAPPEPVYTGAVTITVSRARDGTIVASQAISRGHFKLRVKRGLYDVSSVPPNPSPQPCLTGETRRVEVRRHRFIRLELHVQNVCIV
jgi:hypothetical protein